MSYTNVHVHISENQQHNLKHAVDTKSPVSIRLGYEDLFGSDVLALTNSQLNTMIKALQNGKGITIKMSKCQVVHNMKTEGGFLLVLAGLAADALPLFGKDCLAKPNNWGTFRCRVGFGSKSNKQDNGKWVVFEKRLKHRKSRNRRSRTVFETIQRFGAWHGWRWFVFETGGQVISGHGLLLGPNSPLKNIPVLG